MGSTPSRTAATDATPASSLGCVKFFNQTRAFGFIKSDDGASVFVHGSNVHGGLLAEGDRVEFLIGTDRKTGKVQAHSVRVVR